MTRIDRIRTLSHPGPLREYVWPTGSQGLEPFARYNLIYGLNGSGKTTITRVLQALEKGREPQQCHVELEIDGRRVLGEQFVSESIGIRVFNSDYIASTVLASGGDDVPPIFVFGSASVALQGEVDTLRGSLAEFQAELGVARLANQAADRELNMLCRQEAKSIKEQLSSAGHNPYNNYNKTNFRRAADNIVDVEATTTQRLSDDERRALVVQCTSRPKPTLVAIEADYVPTDAIAEAVNGILSVSVVSKVIRELEEDTRSAAWVLEGLDIHRSKGSEWCLFCGQSIPHDRFGHLDAHFNSAYLKLLEAIDEQIETLKREVSRLGSFALPSADAFYDNLVAGAAQRVDLLRTELKDRQQYVEGLVGELIAKRDRVFESYELTMDRKDNLSVVVANLNRLISQHNAFSQEFDKQLNDARARLEFDLVARILSSYRQRKRQVETSRRTVDELETKVGRLTLAIRQKERSILEHQRPAEELNQELHLYLGHRELEFSVKDTGYEISRNGILAESLSEGEKTAIALLYFLKALQGRDFDLSEGIVVLDDPVSSLDANALYAAFGFIRDRTNGAAQLIALTHNFTFFREMRRWMSSESIKEDSSFYMLDVKFEDGQRLSTLRELDPLLRYYESDYHYVFSRIYWYVHGDSRPGLDENYVLPNMARRLLERFFAFCRPQKPAPGSLENQLAAANVPSPTRTRISRFVNTHSHADSIDEAEHDLHILGEANQVLRDILDVMEQEEPNHYRRMEKLVRQGRSAGSNA